MQTPLHSLEQQAGAHFVDDHGWQVPADFGDFEAEYRALHQAAGIVDLCSRGKIVAAGSDHVAYLHRMLSNEVKQLPPGEGNYCFLLDAQGHILADMNLLVQHDRIVLDTEGFLAGKLRGKLDDFVIMDQVELEDASSRFGTIGIEGPLSREVVSSVLGVEPPHMKAVSHILPEADPDVILARISWSPEGFWLMAPVARIPEFWERLNEAARSFRGRPVGQRAIDVARVEAGIPRYGADLSEGNIPHETGQFRAISFTKGCYPGQEIVERVRSRGQVNRRLAGVLAAAGTQLNPDTRLAAGDKEAGHVTSAVHSPSLGRDIGLAYIRREFLDPGTRLQAGGAPVEVAPLPFPLS